MRYILLALALWATPVLASDRDDIKAFVKSQSVSGDTSIKDFTRYQRERLRTYPEAVAHHTKTKQTVIVWVGFSDSDELFKMWQQTKDMGYHVFVKDFDGVYTGVVIGRDFSGTFGRLGTITSDYVNQIKHDIEAKYTPAPTQTQSTPTCVDGKCYLPSAPFYGSPGGYCPPGRSK